MASANFTTKLNSEIKKMNHSGYKALYEDFMRVI